MNKFYALIAALFLGASPAVAQWQTPNHSVPIGRGGGVTGFGSAVPGIAGRPLIDNGASADPSFGTIANSGFTPGAADTVKGSLNGTTTVDLSLPNCTGVNQAWRYASGVGINCGTVSVTTGFDMPVNLGLSASAVGNALTINLTQADGTAPSSSGPVLVPFRSLTATNGTVTWDVINSTRTVVIPSGATLGTSSGNVPFRVWIFVEHSGGFPVLAVATCSNNSDVFPCAAWETTLKTSTTISGASNTSGVLYTGTGVAADAVRIIGFCDFASGLTTAGTWASACTSLQVMGPGVKKPGDTIQVISSGAAITPTSAINLIKVTAYGTSSGTGAGSGAFAIVTSLLRGATPLSTQTLQGSAVGGQVAGSGFMFSTIDAPRTVSATTYSTAITSNPGLISPALTSNKLIAEEIMS